MEEKPKFIIDDDDIEILDFDDDEIIDESPNTEEIIIEDIITEPDVIEETNNINVIKDTKPLNVEEIDTKEIIEPVEIPNPTIEEPTVTNNYSIDNDQQASNTSLLNQTLNIEDKNENQVTINNVFEDEEAKTIIKEIPQESKTKIEKEEKQQKGRFKTIIVGILIFVVLLGAIIALPFISSYVNTKENTQKSNNENKDINTIEKFVSNIDVEQVLQNIKDYKNYQYQNINIISTKDNTEQLMSIKNNYTYGFNETKFEVHINKTVADFSYEAKDYYEKLDNVYHLYINDITTKTYTKKNTTVDEFNKIASIFPNMINYLMRNYSVTEEKLLKVGNKQHIDITIKTSKEIINYMSVETDRIKNKIDFNNLEQEFVYVDLLFDEDEKLYKIEIEIEDKNASQEQLENSIESAILKYVFTDFNKVTDITLPNL